MVKLLQSVSQVLHFTLWFEDKIYATTLNYNIMCLSWNVSLCFNLSFTFLASVVVLSTIQIRFVISTSVLLQVINDDWHFVLVCCCQVVRSSDSFGATITTTHMLWCLWLTQPAVMMKWIKPERCCTMHWPTRIWPACHVFCLLTAKTRLVLVLNNRFSLISWRFITSDIVEIIAASCKLKPDYAAIFLLMHELCAHFDFFMPSPAIGCRRHAVFGLSVCP